MNGTTLLLVLPLPIFRTGDRVLIDAQALNGLHRWLDNFDRLILCMPELPAAAAPGDTVTLDLDALGGRCRLVPFPNARSPHRFFFMLRPMVKLLDQLIDQSTHLSFAIGGLFGDWAAVGALRAARKHRAASVWTDRVESEVMRFAASQATGLRRLYRYMQAFLMKRLEHVVIRRTSVGLFHGADCYDAYAVYSPEPHLVHDIHLSAAARIPADELTAKLDHVGRGNPLNIVYAGRMHPDKGVLDWIETLKLVAERGVAFNATCLAKGLSWRSRGLP